MEASRPVGFTAFKRLIELGIEAERGGKAADLQTVAENAFKGGDEAVVRMIDELRRVPARPAAGSNGTPSVVPQTVKPA